MKRKFYCVQDKVDVSGTTFTACFTVLYTYLFISNLLSGERYISGLSFWMQGVFYYIFLLYGLASYRDTRELCFYCKWEMSMGALHCALGFFFMTAVWHWGYCIFVLIIFGCTMMLRQAQREDREE